jgi:hypothetical protein
MKLNTSIFNGVYFKAGNVIERKKFERENF